MSHDGMFGTSLLTASTAFFHIFSSDTEQRRQPPPPHPPKKAYKNSQEGVFLFYFIFNSQTRTWLSDNNLDICQGDNQTEKVLWVCNTAATSGVEIAGGLPNTAEPRHCKGISSLPFLKQFGIKGWKKGCVCERQRKERERETEIGVQSDTKKAENFNFHSFFKANTQFPKNIERFTGKEVILLCLWLPV